VRSPATHGTDTACATLPAMLQRSMHCAHWGQCVRRHSGAARCDNNRRSRWTLLGCNTQTGQLCTSRCNCLTWKRWTCLPRDQQGASAFTAPRCRPSAASGSRARPPPVACPCRQAGTVQGRHPLRRQRQCSRPPLTFCSLTLSARSVSSRPPRARPAGRTRPPQRCAAACAARPGTRARPGAARPPRRASPPAPRTAPRPRPGAAAPCPRSQTLTEH